ncbi:UNVERIFIED_CONTAM: hypothetical protein GTU68_020180 [Idotea baltica]|nr:hypothetical protein [Idotea baltica]
MTGQVIAYRRVSTVGQNTVRQLDGLAADREFTDKASGSNAERPELMRMLAHIRKDDEIHVHSIDRLARNLADLLSIIAQITTTGASVKFYKEGLTFDGGDSPMQKMQMQIMGAVAEFERSIINERASEGRAIARAKGVRFGRKPSLTSTQIATLRDEHARGKSIRDLALDYDVGRSTISRALSN